MQQPVPDPYRTLGVSRGATDAQIKAAHRALAKRYHPDAATGDTVRFLRVQEAYQVLADPLRRREWDARHAPGPVRAGAAGPRPRAANGRWTGADDAPGATTTPGARGAPGASASGRGRARSAAGPGGSTSPSGGAAAPGARDTATPGRDRPGRGYTWSASEVPWWEDRGPRESRRQPGRQPPREAAPGAGPPAGGTRPADATAHREAAHDFDVYNRSSGAAWSSAARAYFRRAEAELPRRGSFQHQGTQPLTAARARAAAEEEARRREWDEQRRAAQPRPVARADEAPNTKARRPARQSASSQSSTAASDRPGRRSPESARGVNGPQPGYAWAGVARGVGSIASARSGWRDQIRSTRWPTLSERLVYALIAWVPAAVLIGYSGSALTGCDRAAVSCPPGTEAVQTVLIAFSLGLLVALPRIAYTAAIATIAVALAAIGAVVASWLLGFGPPMPPLALVVIGVFLVVVYLATTSWVLADGPRRRPWLPPARAYHETRR